MARTVFSSRRHRSLCYNFNTFPNYNQIKYVKIYETCLEPLKMYSKAIRILSKGHLPINFLPPSKLERILNEVRMALSKTNKDYKLVLMCLYLYFDMKLVICGIDKKRNLIVQFPVFVQPYTEKVGNVSNWNCPPFQFWTKMIKHSGIPS